MSSTITNAQVLSPTLALKGIDSEPISDVLQISETDFHNYVPTGLYVVIDTPLAKNSKEAIFGVNIDGFIPTYVYPQEKWNAVYRNMMPIQIFESALSYAKVFQEQINLPVASLFASHRFVQGNVGIGVRVTSNTSQSGNMMVSQASLVMRHYYAEDEPYRGLRFLNAAAFTTDYTSASFQVVDMSLNRQLSITPLRRNPNRVTDLAKKIDEIEVFHLDTPEKIEDNFCFVNQFVEDWLIFCPASNWPDQNANQIRLDFYFDYTNVTFLVELLPIIPLNSLSNSQQILKYSDANNDHVSADKHDLANWLPG